MTAYSVLEQAPTRDGQEPGEPFRRAEELARHVDPLGFERLWVAEHHAIASVGIAAPEVVVGHLASVTRHLRIGSGGMLLPNHRPIHVAEQFRGLAALHPGRIDLGIGRSDGSLDEQVIKAFGRSDDLDHGAGFDDQLDQLLAFGGVRPLPDDHELAGVLATPDDVPLPPVFLLGSSPNSAATAGARGLAYGFAVHTNPDGAADALRRYREAFVPREGPNADGTNGDGARPHAILALKVVVGEDEEHARALAEPSALALVGNRLGRPWRLLPVEEALRHEWTEEELEVRAKQHPAADVVGDADQVATRLEALVEETGADEVIAITNTTDPDERLRAITRLADAVGLARR